MITFKKQILFGLCLLLSNLSACGDDDPVPAGDTGTATDTTSEADVTADYGGGDGDDASSDGEGIEIAIDNLTLTEDPGNVLMTWVIFLTDIESHATVEVAEVASGATFTVNSTTSGVTVHEIAVFGLLAETEYTFTVNVEDGAGGSGTSGPQTYTTSPLPADFPPITISPEGAEFSSDYIFTSVNRWNPDLDQGWGMLVVLDRQGRPVWYYQAGLPISDANRLEDGSYGYIFGLHGAAVVDSFGDQSSFWLANTVGLEVMHHSISEFPNGDLLIVGSEMREVDGYPDGEGGTRSYYVVGDRIARITREGAPVDYWSVWDYYDPLVDLSSDFDDTFFNMVYVTTEIETTKDWTHCNAALVDPSDDSLILSFRHLDRIVKLDPVADEIIWEFGDGFDFTLEDGGQWQYHQHAPDLQENGNILIYDNGNNRAEYGPDDVPYTRVVEYALDTTNPDDLRAEQVWEYRGEEPYYASYVGDANSLPNGNVLITDGGILSDPTAFEGDPDDGRWARIVEVTRDSPAELVAEARFGGGEGEGPPVGYQLFRSTDFESLYQ